MNDNEAAEDTLLTLTADIVAAHVSNNSVAVNDLPTLIQNVHSALSGISGARGGPEPKPEPRARTAQRRSRTKSSASKTGRS
jgi:predicted transcriptional regulator